MTLNELADAVGVSRSTITNLERGIAKGLNPSTRKALEDYFCQAGDSLENSGSTFPYRELIRAVLDVLDAPDFESRVKAAAEVLRVSEREARALVVEADVNKIIK